MQVVVNSSKGGPSLAAFVCASARSARSFFTARYLRRAESALVALAGASVKSKFFQISSSNGVARTGREDGDDYVLAQAEGRRDGIVPVHAHPSKTGSPRTMMGSEFCLNAILAQYVCTLASAHNKEVNFFAKPAIAIGVQLAEERPQVGHAECTAAQTEPLLAG